MNRVNPLLASYPFNVLSYLSAKKDLKVSGIKTMLVLLTEKGQSGMIYIVSACLAGINCRYDGGNNFCAEVAMLARMEMAIPVCPEQLGGLSTPRNPCEISGDRIFDCKGTDLTERFLMGVNESLKITEMFGCTGAILKQRSPSCGYGMIYDGSFTRKVKVGNGFFAQALFDKGLTIFTEESLPEFSEKE
jgi:uncharacterized protein YbbK (DUF523 family)